jgi:hypothetical protein
VSRVGKAGEVERVLVGGSGDDGVGLTFQREPGRVLNSVAGDTSGLDGPVTIGLSFSAAEFPASYRDSPPSRYRGDLVLRPNQRYFSF